ncbi:helix-turn-helix domain-containing protein [Patescibacteria group bacterium]
MKKTIYSKEHQLLSRKLQQARLECGLKQAEVAKKMDKTQSYISKIESGQRKIDVTQLKYFAKIYKKNLNFFIN